jgi:hypothetical protein
LPAQALNGQCFSFCTRPAWSNSRRTSPADRWEMT